MIKNKLKLTLNTLALLIIATLTINTVSAQLHVVKEQTDNQGNIISEAGDVGIGIEFPTEKLDIDGSFTMSGGFLKTGSTERVNAQGNTVYTSTIQVGKNRTADGHSYIDLYPTAGSGYAGRFLSGRNSTGIYSIFSHQGDGDFSLRTYKPTADLILRSASEIKYFVGGLPVYEPALLISSNGNIGIGTSTPTEKLQINGNLKVDGDAYISGGGEWTGVSDKRTKKNINQYSKGLEEVLKINPVTYNYSGKAGIKDTENTYVGLIAQEYAEIEPGAVKPFSYTEEGSNKTEEYFSLNASSVKYMLVNAVKEQQSLIETQKAELETLKETVAKLAANGASISTPGATEISVQLEGTGTETALLAQNMPNPFTTSTRIEYFIPADSRHCRMSFRDMSGKELKQVNIKHDGIGAIELSAKDLAVGIYSYVLYVNGDIAASKKMILKQ